MKMMGIVGLPLAGKKTLFNILSCSGKNVIKRKSGEVAITKVHDERIDKLSEIYDPKRTIYADMEFVLAPSIEKDKKGNPLGELQKVDGLFIVIKGFSLYPGEDVDPERDFNYIYSELILFDLDMVERALSRVEKVLGKVKDPNLPRRYEVLKKCRAHLEEEKPLKLLDFSKDEIELIRDLGLLTLKPMMVLFNIHENDIGRKIDFPVKDIPYDAISLKIEEELMGFSEEEQKEFLADMGLVEPALTRIVKDAFKSLDLISFFTVGKDEVRAWPIKKGTTAKRAAREVHSDIERGFIRAEVIAYEDFIKAGSEKEAKKLNLYRLEGKDYIVQDGDIINFRFNV